ncbi:hypothetical protein [Pseudomonas fluorescens]|jgi:hypothetical protein|uniref:hypothetical protein n=1 Tax=Pseudomonas fluorescens TaxID=294 RepID=UPI000CA3B484|nr:hypothetical protein [Pseudomonas fluorescens]AUM69680.1 hypothetical protein C0J56_12775 [Pseudomonas fluorescens]MDP9780458.1 hypothetical protein [Pseudomonas fluorescens]
MASLIIDAPNQNATISPKPFITGTGPANTRIMLYEANVGGREWGSTVVDSLGNWVMKPNFDLEPTPGKNNGRFGMVVTPDPNLNQWSNIIFVNIAKTPPFNANQPLKILSPVEGATIYPRFSIAGTGPANTTITLYEANVGGREWGKTSIDAFGNWVMIPNDDLQPTPGKNNGMFGLLVTPDSKSWSNIVPVNIARTAPFTPNQPLTILSPRQGTSTFARPSIAGTGPANTTITLYEANVGDRQWGSTVIDAYGNWFMTPSDDLQPTPGKNNGMFGLLVTPDSKSWSNVVGINVYKTTV